MSYTQTMDILSVCFFLVAGAWLVAALLYSLLVLCFLRLRATNQLGNLHDEDFGRVHIVGNCYLPLGCIFRRYARHLQMDDDGRGHVRFMTRSERRAAMQILLHIENETVDGTEPSQTVDTEQDDQSNDGPTCSICLDSLENAFCSDKCTHQYCSGCILDWLQRNDNTACPECRIEMVKEEDVWKTVKNMRREKRKQLRLERRKLRKSTGVEEEEMSETEEMDDDGGDVGV